MKNLTRPLRALVAGMILMCAAAHAEEQLSVLSWNTEHYGWERRSPAERTLLESNMFAVVRAVQPDIFLMQETYGSFERFKAALPGYDARLLGRCNAIFSRFPIVGTHEPYREKANYGEPQGGAFNTQVADLDAGCMRLRACPVAMFWLPLCVRTPADKTPDELLAWENERQPYEAAPRPQAMAGILAGMAPFLAEKDEVPILMAGDFNSHSHLDWTTATGNWQGHHGRTVPWPVSSQMVKAGFYDVFRALYPDPAANYGATAPLPGVLADCPKPFLRIDYIYAAGKRLRPVSFEIIAGDYHRPFVWHGRSFSAFPSDHAAVLAQFVVDTRGKQLRRDLADSSCPMFGMTNSTLQLEGWIDATGNLVAAHDAATLPEILGNTLQPDKALPEISGNALQPDKTLPEIFGNTLQPDKTLPEISGNALFAVKMPQKP